MMSMFIIDKERTDSRHHITICQTAGWSPHFLPPPYTNGRATRQALNNMTVANENASKGRVPKANIVAAKEKKNGEKREGKGGKYLGG